MIEPTFTDADLIAYADELLVSDEATAIEDQLRSSQALRQRLAMLLKLRDQGGHTLGEVWRRQRLSCPSRSDLGSYLLGARCQCRRVCRVSSAHDRLLAVRGELG